MKIKLLVISLLASFALVACSDNATEEGTPASEPGTENVRELVYDLSNRNITGKSAITMPDKLIVSSDGKDTVYDLTKDEFFVSVAPYINQTHP